MPRTAGEEQTAAVRIEAQFEVGEYEVVILSADDSMALDTWLRAENYNIPEGAEPALRPYIESGMYFFVAKVNLEKVIRDEEGRSVLSPLRFHYEAETFSLPVRLGLLNARDKQDLIISILARGQRYEVANKPNVTIPTNIDLQPEAKERFGEFYAALLDATLEKNPGAVVTEYSWDASTCDPCPGPTLTGQDFMSLGSDVLPGQPQYGFVLTRLHARYGAQDLADDLVFQAASPIVGGREVRSGENNTLEHSSSPSGMNNFQGRYAIRHPWAGEVACENPVRGRWGGPPGHDYRPTGAPGVRAEEGAGVTAATDTAFAARGSFEIAAVLDQDIDQNNVRIVQADDGAATPPTTPVEDGAGEGAEGPRAAPAPAPAANESAAQPEEKGCSVADLRQRSEGGGAPGALTLFALMAAALVIRARR